jgi:hypothetical protein
MRNISKDCVYVNSDRWASTSSFFSTESWAVTSIVVCYLITRLLLGSLVGFHVKCHVLLGDIW